MRTEPIMCRVRSRPKWMSNNQRYLIWYDVLYLTGCVKHIPESLPCPPRCQAFCTADCPHGCCVATPPNYPGIYSLPLVPLRPVSRYQCPYPCPTACAPKCSPKCCNAVPYQSPLYIKRKAILKKQKKHNLQRRRHILLRLKQMSSRKRMCRRKKIQYRMRS